MRRFIAQLLSLSILLAGVAWAVDTHSQAYSGYDTKLSSVDGDPPNGFSDDGLAEHCCHATAHYLGLLLVPATVIADNDTRVTLVAVSSHHSHANAPPIRPPKS